MTRKRAFPDSVDTARRRRQPIAVATALALVLSLGACTAEPPPEAEDGGIPAPALQYVGDAIRVDVDPAEPLAVAIPGLGRITGPSGAFSESGQIVVRQLAADSPEGSLITADGPGVDVTFESTQLVSPLTVLFDDPAIGAALPGDALPLVLHRPDGSPWEALAVEFTPDGVPFLVTSDFSPNVLSWIQPPSWLTGVTDDVVNWFGGGTKSRGCEGGQPPWSWIASPSAQVHLCVISNTDQASGAVRAELQVQSNRQYFQWVSIPQGNDYLWVDGQPDVVRQIIGSITGHDWTREALLPEESWLSAGYQQTANAQSLDFRSYADGWSTALDLLRGLIGFTPDGGGWASLAVIAAKCGVAGADSTVDFLGCAIQTAGEHLRDPDKAFAAAMDILGEESYAQAYSAKLTSIASRLQWLGQVVKALGIGLAVRTVLLRLLDWGSTSTNPRFGNFVLNLDPLPHAPVAPAPPPPAQSDPQPAPPQNPPPAPAPATPKAWVTRSGDTITYHWQNMPAGMWPEVDRFRCWRYTMTTHPGGWASDGCGQQTGFAGYPSGSSSVSFTYGGASDSFSIEPWKYGPWLSVGESWQG